LSSVIKLHHLNLGSQEERLYYRSREVGFTLSHQQSNFSVFFENFKF
jgi:hypothetical protein